MNRENEERIAYHQAALQIYDVKQCRHIARGQRMIFDERIGTELVEFCHSCGIDLT